MNVDELRGVLLRHTPDPGAVMNRLAAKQRARRSTSWPSAARPPASRSRSRSGRPRWPGRAVTQTR